MDLLKGLEEISATLDILKKECAIVDYALIGGLAVSIWGRPRATRDIDLLLLLDVAADVNALAERLVQKGIKSELIKGDLRDPIPYLLKIVLETVEIDVIIATKRWEFDAVENAVSIDLGAKDISIVSPEYLIIMKLKAGGPRDMLDVQDILETGDIDLEKTKSLAKSYRVDKKLERLMLS